MEINDIVCEEQEEVEEIEMEEVSLDPKNHVKRDAEPEFLEPLTPSDEVYVYFSVGQESRMFDVTVYLHKYMLFKHIYQSKDRQNW